MTPPMDPDQKPSPDVAGKRSDDTTYRDDTRKDTQDEQLAAELDDHLQRLWAGGAAGPGEASSDIDQLRSILTRLHAVGELLGSVESSEGAGTSATAVPTEIGKYSIRRVLGRGGQATTYLAFDPDLRRQVVIKLYHGARTGDESDLVLREGRALVRVNSPYVAACYAAEKHKGVPYLVLEYIPGETLADVCRTRRFTVKETQRFVEQLARGVAAVHACGLVHRDLKPGNILIADDGKPRIVDFGLAVPLASDELAGISGTLAYMAPEQARGELERIDHRTDLFALGAVWYQMLAGEPIYQADSPRELLELARKGDIVPVDKRVADSKSPLKIPPPVAELCGQCLARDPRYRPSSADRLVELVERQTRGRALSFALGLGNWRFTMTIGVATCLVMLAMFPLIQWQRPQGNVAFNVGAAPDSPPAPTGAENPDDPSAPAPPDAAAPDDPPAPAPPGPVAPKDPRAFPLQNVNPRLHVDSARGTESPVIHPKQLNPVDTVALLVAAAQENPNYRLTRGEIFATGQVLLTPNRECHVRVWLIRAEGNEHLQLFPAGDDSDVLKAGGAKLVPEGMIGGELMRGARHVLVLASTGSIPEVELKPGAPYATITQEQIDSLRAELKLQGELTQLRGEVVEIEVPAQVEPVRQTAGEID